ncbi:hypothetical protein EGW08_014931, partial [Elysia chlorotica]
FSLCPLASTLVSLLDLSPVSYLQSRTWRVVNLLVSQEKTCGQITAGGALVNTRTTMLKLLICAVVAVVAVECSSDSEWEKFKSTHAKVYSDKDEDIKRRGIWEANVVYINEHNAKYNKGEETFFLGQNEFADMTNEEYKKMFLGYQMHNDTDGNTDFYSDEDISALPDQIDWRAYGYVTDVKRQEMCASSYAFAAAGAIEGQMFRRYGNSQSLSAQNIIDCASKCMGCLGGCTIKAFQYVADNKGISTSSGYPYQGTKLRQCMYSKCNYGGKCSGYRKVTRYSEKALQSAVANVGPVAVGIDASHITFQLYLGGVYHNPICNKFWVNHAALVTGYGALRSGSYWLVKNSFGPKWGYGGYVLMSRYRSNNCGIATEASYPTTS